ncbi:DUF6622 family protein [Devosia sp.]|uniref:DUF6622 family protein n=1 Tax=Devosia sp. TaxID=1871048 RepID=UPI003F7302C8
MSPLSILTHTPLWVWPVLALIIVIGLKRTQDRTVSAPRLVLMPLVILGLAGWNLAALGGSLTAMAGLGIGIVVGTSAGLTLESRAGTTQVSRGVVHLKGDWVSFFVLLAIFAMRYATTVVSIAAPAIAASDAYHFVTALLSGFFAFLTLSRTGLRLRVAYA